jgi:hypothetical protein
MYSADRRTHLKIVVVGLVAATLVAGIGVSARLADTTVGANGRVQASGPAVKATTTSVVTTREESSTIR